MSQLIDINGNPLKRDALREPQTAKLTSLHREFSGHPARGLTPAKLASILLNAEQGDLIAQSELFMDMQERDAHIFSEMSKRKSAVLIPDWTVEPPRNATAAEKADAEYAGEYLEDLENLEDLFKDLMEGLGHGFAPVEIDGWQMHGKEWFPKSFELRPQTWFQLAPDNQNELRLRGAMGGEELQPLSWITHRPRALAGYVARSGLYRVLAWPYLFKHYAVSDLAEMLEIYGLPIRLGKYPPGTAEHEKTTLLRAVMALGHSAAGIIPESMSIDFEKAAEGSSEPFLSMMHWCEESVSKAVLGATLTSNTSASGGGAHALGEVHNEVRMDLRDSDCKQLAATISRDLIWPVVMLNRGAKDPRRAPRLKFDLREPADLASLATALPSLVNVGFRIPLEWAQDKAGIPEPVGDEPILGTVTPTKDNQTTNNQGDNKKPETEKGIVDPAQPKAPKSEQVAEQAALTSMTPLAPAFSDQQQLDAAVNDIPAADTQAQSMAMLEPLIAAISAGKSEVELLGLLAEQFPNSDESELTDALHKMMFAADVWGRLFTAAEQVG